MTQAETAALLAYLTTFFPREITDAGVRAYHFELGDLDAEDAWAAAQYLVRTGRFFPTIAEIRDACEQTLEPMEAWRMACLAQELESTEGLDEVTRDALRLTWGWVNSSVDTGPATRRAFLEAYASVRRRRVMEETKLLTAARGIPQLGKGES